MKSKYIVFLSLLLSLGTVPVFGMEQKTKSKGKEKDTELTVMQKSMATLPPEMKGEVLYHFYNKDTNTPFDPLNCHKLIELLPPKLTDTILDKVAWPLTGFFYKRISKQNEWEERFKRLPADLKKRVTRNLQLMAGPKKTREYKCPDSIQLLYGQTSIGTINNKILALTEHGGYIPLVSVWDKKTGNYLYDLPRTNLVIPIIYKDKLVIPHLYKIEIYSLGQEKAVRVDTIATENEQIHTILNKGSSLIIATANTQGRKIYHYNMNTKELTLSPSSYNPSNWHFPQLLYSKRHVFYRSGVKTIKHWDISKGIVEDIKTEKEINFFTVSNHRLILKGNSEIQIIDIDSGKTQRIPFGGKRTIKQIHIVNNNLIVESYICTCCSDKLYYIDIINLLDKTVTILNNCNSFEIVKNNILYYDKNNRLYKIINLNTKKAKALNSLRPHIFDDFIVTFYIAQQQCELDFFNLNGSLLCTVPVNEGVITINNDYINSKPYLLAATGQQDRLLKYDFPQTLEEAVKIIQEQAKTEK